MIKTKRMLKLGCFVYNSRVQMILINCDQLLFLKKYKNMWNLLKISLYEKRLYILVSKLLRFRTRHLWGL